VVAVLLEHGANVEISNMRGTTALHAAACHGHLSVVKLLVEHGAKISSADTVGCNALNCACLHGYVSILQFFIDQGADIEAQFSSTGGAKTILLYCCMSQPH
jgi:ankyrin repeat protein